MKHLLTTPPILQFGYLSIKLASTAISIHALFNVYDIVDSIWIVGSSLIKRAEQYASISSEFGTDLLLPGVSVLWKGVSGLSFDSVTDIICDLRSKYPHPRFLVIHTGGNDIGKDDNPLFRQQKFI